MCFYHYFNLVFSCWFKRIFDHGLDAVFLENDDTEDVAKCLRYRVKHILLTTRTRSLISN